MSDKVYVPGSGSLGAKLFILGEAPSYQETNMGRAFVGPSGKELDRLLNDADINRSDCWISNVCKYEVPGNNRKGKKIPFHIRAKTAGIDLDEQLQELKIEIEQVNPNCILALGGTALWALSGKTKISNFRGSIMSVAGHKFVPTYHPAHLLHQASGEFKGYWNRQVMVFDFKRAKYQSTFRELNLPYRTIEICASSYQFGEFINRYKDKYKMSVDIEALGTCIPGCVGIAFNKRHAMVIPLWNVGGISSIHSVDLVQIWILLANLLYEKGIIGQNFNYDRDKLRRLGFIIRKLVSDTMYKAQAINPELPKALAFNTSIFTEEPFYKDEGMYEGSLQDLFIGCGRDACVTFEIDENMDKDLDELNQRGYYENFLMKLPDLYLGIENQGMAINPNTRDELLRKYVEWDERIDYELFKIVGAPINVNSSTQVWNLLFENWKLPQKDTTGEEDITALLNSPTALNDPSKRRACELILEGRRVKKTISTYLMALPDYDGRMRTTCFPCLDTGRSSNGQQDPPIRPKIEIIDQEGKKKQKVLGTAFQTMTKHGDIGADVRGMYIPDNCHIEVIDNDIRLVEEEEIFVQADSSQAEARVVWLLANDENALKLVDEIDYHALTATWFFGGKEDDYSKKMLGYEHPIRFAGKTLRHAGHLGAQKRRASIEVNTQARKYKIDIHISEQVAGQALEIFHRKQPAIQQVFQTSVVECLKKNRQLVAPLPYGIDAPEGGKRTFYERWGEDLFRQAFSYLPQRTVTDNTKAAGLRIKERIPLIKIVMESHDALLFSIPISKQNLWIPVIKQEMERPILFENCSIPRRSLIIPCEVEIGKNYKDLKKFKFLSDIDVKSEARVDISNLTMTQRFLIN